MMRIAGVKTRVVIGAALLSWALTPTPSWAHDRSAPVHLVAAPLARNADGLLLAALAAVMVLGLGGRRRFAFSLAVVLAVLGFEVGLHSTHHLADPARAARCAVATATLHLDGTPVDASGHEAIVARAPDPAPPGLRVQVLQRRPAPHEGRAPPVRIA
jgi:hypothetical protein